MQLAIKNHWISLGGSSSVQDMNGNDVLKVEGALFTLTRKKFLKTLEGRQLYTIRNKFFSFLGRTAFVLDEGNNVVATVRKKLISLHDKYFVESSIGQMEIIGNILGYDYHIIVDGKEVGHIARNPLTLHVGMNMKVTLIAFAAGRLGD